MIGYGYGLIQTWQSKAHCGILINLWLFWGTQFLQKPTQPQSCVHDRSDQSVLTHWKSDIKWPFWLYGSLVPDLLGYANLIIGWLTGHILTGMKRAIPRSIRSMWCYTSACTRVRHQNHFQKSCPFYWNCLCIGRMSVRTLTVRDSENTGDFDSEIIIIPKIWMVYGQWKIPSRIGKSIMIFGDRIGRYWKGCKTYLQLSVGSENKHGL